MEQNKAVNVNYVPLENIRTYEDNLAVKSASVENIRVQQVHQAAKSAPVENILT